MQATITYLLTEQAQRAQMAATGQPVAHKQTMTVEIIADDLPLCQVAEDGSLTLSTADGWDIDGTYHGRALRCAGWSKDHEATMYAPDVLADIRRGRALLDAAYAEACRVTSQYVRDSDESMDRPENRYHLYVPYTVLPKTPVLDAHPRIDSSKYDRYGVYSSDLEADAMELLRTRSAAKTQQHNQDVAAALDRLTNYDSSASIGVGNARVCDVSSSSSPIIAAAYARWKKRKAEAERAAKAIADGRELAKTDAIDAFVAASGDTLLIAQHADGMLCRKTIIARMATAALDAAGLPEICPDSTVCNDRDCPCCDNVVDCIPPAVYARWKAMGLPDDATVEFHKVRNCQRDENEYADDGETAGPTEYHAIVTIQSGPFQFTRRTNL